MYTLDYFTKLVESTNKKYVVSCAAPYDEATIEALDYFVKKGVLVAKLVGDEDKIITAINKASASVKDYEILHCIDLEEIANISVKLVSENKADFLLKSLIDTSILLKTYLKSEYSLKTGNVLSHVAVYFKPNTEKMYLVTDAGMNIAPNIEQKKQIIENAVQVARSIGIDKPNVAMLCAKEKEYDKMPATLEAGQLQRMNIAGEIENCVVSGPLQLDNAISKESAAIKQIKDPVAGVANILVAPDIEAGNILAKTLTYLAEYDSGGIVVGGKAPIALSSRSDGYEERLVGIVLCMLSFSFNNLK